MHNYIQYHTMSIHIILVLRLNHLDHNHLLAAWHKLCSDEKEIGRVWPQREPQSRSAGVRARSSVHDHHVVEFLLWVPQIHVQLRSGAEQHFGTRRAAERALVCVCRDRSSIQ